MRFSLATVQESLAAKATVCRWDQSWVTTTSRTETLMRWSACAWRGGRASLTLGIVEANTAPWAREWGVNVFPGGVAEAVPMQPRDRRLRMSAANGSTLENLRRLFCSSSGRHVCLRSAVEDPRGVKIGAQVPWRFFVEQLAKAIRNNVELDSRRP